MIPKEQLGAYSENKKAEPKLLSPSDAAAIFRTSIEDILRRIQQPTRVELFGASARHKLLKIDNDQISRVYTVHGQEAGQMTDPEEAERALIELISTSYGFNEISGIEQRSGKESKTGDKNVILSTMSYFCPGNGLFFVRDTAAHFIENPSHKHETKIHSINWHVTEVSPPSVRINGKVYS